MIQDIDQEEAKRIGSVIGRGAMVQAAGCAYTRGQAGTDTKRVWDLSNGLAAGLIIGRLELIEQSEAFPLPPLERFDAAKVGSIAMDPHTADTEKETAITAYVYKLLWQAFRYGYYQALDDKEE